MDIFFLAEHNLMTWQKILVTWTICSMTKVTLIFLYLSIRDWGPISSSSNLAINSSPNLANVIEQIVQRKITTHEYFPQNYWNSRAKNIELNNWSIFFLKLELTLNSLALVIYLLIFTTLILSNPICHFDFAKSKP